MNNVAPLFAVCERLGAELRPAPQGKLSVRWIEPLPESLKGQLRQHKQQILVVLNACGWLREKLSTGPKRIWEMYSEWRRDVLHDPLALGDDLTQARWVLGVEAHIGSDEFMWWHLPADKMTIQ